MNHSRRPHKTLTDVGVNQINDVHFGHQQNLRPTSLN